MKKSLKITLIVIGCLVIIGCASEYYIIDRYPISKTSEFSVDLKEVNRLARAGGGELPTEVGSLVVAESSAPTWYAVVGGGWERMAFPFVAYQIVYPDRTVVIDSGCDKQQLDTILLIPFLSHSLLKTSFDYSNYTLLQKSLRAASHILITHEHFDHIGGIATSPYLSEILPKLLLSKEQVESPEMKKAGFPKGVPPGYERIPDDQYRRYYRADPGIVLIKAPGHTPGQQIIYVVTKDGKEYLFISDIVYNREDLKRRAYRSYLYSLVLNEDRDSAMEEFRWVLDNLYDNLHNKIIYVISHDKDQLREYIEAGVIKDGFK